MKRLFNTLISYVAVLIIMSPSALAQTPDEETPANEGVCDVLIGGTPGLYGLCVAFCEAQDFAALSDPITEEDFLALESAAPSGRILANYDKRKGAGDPPMPCVKVQEPCPCWTESEFLIATAEASQHGNFRCFDIVGGVTETFIQGNEAGVPFSLHLVGALESNRLSCQYISHDSSGAVTARTLFIDRSTYDACRQRVLDRQQEICP